MLDLSVWGWCFWLVILRGKFASTNQKHYPGLTNDASSVWNFCRRSSDVISRGRGGIAKCWLFSQIIKVDPTGYIFETFQKSAEVWREGRALIALSNFRSTSLAFERPPRRNDERIPNSIVVSLMKGSSQGTPERKIGIVPRASCPRELPGFNKCDG